MLRRGSATRPAFAHPHCPVNSRRRQTRPIALPSSIQTLRHLHLQSDARTHKAHFVHLVSEISDMLMVMEYCAMPWAAAYTPSPSHVPSKRAQVKHQELGTIRHHHPRHVSRWLTADRTRSLDFLEFIALSQWAQTPRKPPRSLADIGISALHGYMFTNWLERFLERLGLVTRLARAARFVTGHADSRLSKLGIGLFFANFCVIAGRASGCCGAVFVTRPARKNGHLAVPARQRNHLC